MPTSAKNVWDALVPSLSEGENSVTLEEYGIQVITECQNPGCGNDFDAPIFILVDVETSPKKFVVCADCPIEIVEDDDDDSDEENEPAS